mgnify:CR=1 FL=1
MIFKSFWALAAMALVVAGNSFASANTCFVEQTAETIVGDEDGFNNGFSDGQEFTDQLTTLPQFSNAYPDIEGTMGTAQTNGWWVIKSTLSSWTSLLTPCALSHGANLKLYPWDKDFSETQRRKWMILS